VKVPSLRVSAQLVPLASQRASELLSVYQQELAFLQELASELQALWASEQVLAWGN
jgi:hypothetical protein